MTETEWIDEVLRPWKKGDVLEYQWDREHMLYAEGKWHVEIILDHPVHHNPSLHCRDYRIKPRVTRWVIECESEVSPDTFKRVAQDLDDTDEWTACFIDAFRNAKLMEKSDD